MVFVSDESPSSTDTRSTLSPVSGPVPPPTTPPLLPPPNVRSTTLISRSHYETKSHRPPTHTLGTILVPHSQTLDPLEIPSTGQPPTWVSRPRVSSLASTTVSNVGRSAPPVTSDLPLRHRVSGPSVSTLSSTVSSLARFLPVSGCKQ